MIVTGLTALALATFEHYRSTIRMRDEYGAADRSVAMVVAVIVSGIGLLALIATLFSG